MTHISLPMLPGQGRVVWSEAGKILFADDRFASIVGVEDAHALVGRDYWALSAPGQKQRILNHLLSTQRSCEQELRTQDGQEITVRIQGAADGDGEQRQWYAYVELVQEQGGDDELTADAIARRLRHQNSILLSLGQNQAIDAGELGPAMHALTQAGAQGLRCARSSIWLYTEDKRQIYCHDLFEYEEDRHSDGVSLNADDFPRYFEALAEDRTIAANDAHRHPATSEFSESYLKPLGITSMLEAPIRQNGQLVGVLCSEHIGPARTFSQEEQSFAAAVADFMGRALQAHERAKADRAIRELNAQLEQLVQERTASLQMTLDSMGDGLLRCSIHGVLEAERSKAAESWFGPVPTGTPIWSYMCAHDAAAALAMEMAIEALCEGFLPLSLLVEQLPQRLVRHERTYSLSWRAIVADDEPELPLSLVVIVQDITERLAQERAAALQRELPQIVSHIVSDGTGFASFLEEMARLLGSLTSSHELVVQQRALHTLKGNSAIYGFASFSGLCHALEDQIAQEGQLYDEAAQALNAAWQKALEPLSPFLKGREDGVVLTHDEYLKFVARLEEDQLPRAALISEVNTWLLDRVGQLVKPLANQAMRMANTLGKQVDVELLHANERLPSSSYRAFFASLVHPIRNAIDHGIELPELRAQLGKPEVGKLTVQIVSSYERFEVLIVDDGAGISWDRVAQKARELGLAHDTQEDLVEALFCDGLSTKEEVTSLSGRGVGLSSTLEQCRALGGEVLIESRAGQGTTMRFCFPLMAKLEQSAAE